eukprot:jgi/Bigna1/85463/estExt_fgenesh1_pg.C_40137
MRIVMKSMARAFGGGFKTKEWKVAVHPSLYFARCFSSSPPEPSAEEIAAHDPYRGGEQEINGNPVDITDNLRKRQGQVSEFTANKSKTPVVNALFLQVFTSKSYEQGWNRIFRKQEKPKDASDANSSSPGSGR